MCEALGGVDSKAFDFWLLCTAINGISFEAVDTSDGNKRVGAYLCTTYKNGEKNPIDEQLEAFDEMDEKMELLGGCLDELHLHLRPEIFKKFQIDEYLEGVNLSVLPSYAGLGIAGKLTEAVEERARELHIPMVYVCCSSEYTARVVQKRDYQLIHTLPYEEYLKGGKRVFNTTAPHEAIKCYVKLV